MSNDSDITWFDNRPSRRRGLLIAFLLWIIFWGLVLGIPFVYSRNGNEWLILIYIAIQFAGFVLIISNYGSSPNLG